MESPKPEFRSPKEIRRPTCRKKQNPGTSGTCATLRFPGLGVLTATALLSSARFVLGATNLISADEIPALRPVRPELPPSFWEQYGAWVIIGGTALAFGIAALVWWIARPKPPVVVPPAVTARRALEPLQRRAEDGEVLSGVSRILRHYVANAFALPGEEMTTTEFCGALIRCHDIGPDISVPLTEFLRETDRRKFAPGTLAPRPLQAATEALSFVDKCEARRAQLHQAGTSPATAQAKQQPGCPGSPIPANGP